MKFYEYNTLKNIMDDFVSMYNYEDLMMSYKIENYIIKKSSFKIKNSIKVKSYKEGILKLLTSSSTWKYEISLRKDTLMEEINTEFGENTVREIIIH